MPDLPSRKRRVLAKLLDFLALAFTIVGFGIVGRRYLGLDPLSSAYLFGLAVGYLWLSLSDWGGVSFGKRALGLETVDAETGEPARLLQSAIRNTPILLANMPSRIAQGVLGVDKATFFSTYTMQLWAFLAVVVLALGWALVAWISSEEQRHIGDRWAGTRVQKRGEK